MYIMCSKFVGNSSELANFEAVYFVKVYQIILFCAVWSFLADARAAGNHVLELQVCPEVFLSESFIVTLNFWFNLVVVRNIYLDLVNLVCVVKFEREANL